MELGAVCENVGEKRRTAIVNRPNIFFIEKSLGYCDTAIYEKAPAVTARALLL
jgi:hypothetical protein